MAFFSHDTQQKCTTNNNQAPGTGLLRASGALMGATKEGGIERERERKEACHINTQRATKREGGNLIGLLQGDPFPLPITADSPPHIRNHQTIPVFHNSPHFKSQAFISRLSITPELVCSTRTETRRRPDSKAASSEGSML